MLEGAIGSFASAHLFSTFRKLDWGTELFGPLLLTEEILRSFFGRRDVHEKKLFNSGEAGSADHSYRLAGVGNDDIPDGSQQS